jgi:sporulation protein YlmC with PRC-barrel domain
LARGSDLVGLDVMDAKNVKLGKVEDLLVQDSGGITAVVKREAGGLVCVPMSQLQPRIKAPDKDARGPETADVDAFVFTGDATKLATAPAVDSVDSIDSAAVARSSEHFGAKADKRDADKPHDADKPKDKDGEPVTYGDKDKKTADAMSLKPWGLKKLMGTDIKDSAGEEVGEVKDVAVSLSQSDLAHVVISTGGVMGMGDKLHGISLKRLGHSSDGKSLTLPVTKDSLKSSGEGIDLDRLPSNPDLTGGSTGALVNPASTDDNS